MKYLDSTLFIAAALDPGPTGDRCRALLRMVRVGNLPAATSALTWDELAYVVGRRRGREAGLDAGRRLLAITHLRLVGVDAEILGRADRAAREHGLRPRDALHVACAQKAAATAIVSENRDLDRIPALPREWV